MKKYLNIKYIAAGLAAGALNGLLGAGGGLVLVPTFISLCGSEQKKAMATSVAIIFGLSIASAFVYLRQNIPENILPCVLGGAAGGIAAGFVMKRLPALWLRRGFALLLLYSSFRMVFS